MHLNSLCEQILEVSIPIEKWTKNMQSVLDHALSLLQA